MTQEVDPEVKKVLMEVCNFREWVFTDERLMNKLSLSINEVLEIIKILRSKNEKEINTHTL